MALNKFDKVNVLGVLVSSVTVDDVLRHIQSLIDEDKRAIITHVHVKGLNIAYEQAWFRAFLNNSELVYCDGMGVKLGSTILGKPLPQRLTLADWIWQLVDFVSEKGYKLFLLGNPPGVTDKTVDILRRKNKKISIVGTSHGFFNKLPGSEENNRVIQEINDAKPDILMVGFGMPEQERWLLENWQHLNVNIAITCGAIFEYISGDLSRGPEWMTQNYLEWLARILVSPDRYSKRYLHDNPIFLSRLLRQKFTGSDHLT
jgi:N-acetylglucosaminyldiphosphoundecaprenol N-acetyl-beta-D-mannosaminyltransferase